MKINCEPGYYVVNEIMYEGCGYKVIGDSTKDIVIGSHDGQTQHFTFEFTNEGTGDDRIPNKGYINDYAFNGESGNGTWSYVQK